MFDFQTLKFNFLAQKIIFPVVTDIVLLGFVFCDQSRRIFNIDLTAQNSVGTCFYLCLEIFDTGLQAGNDVFQILHFERKLAAKNFDFINFGSYNL